MADTLPSADEFFGQPQGGELPTADQFFAPEVKASDIIAQRRQQQNIHVSPLGGDFVPQATAAVDAFFAHTAPGRVLNAFGHGAKQAWGTESYAIPDPIQQTLKTTGFWDEYSNTRNTNLKAFNEVLFRPAAAALDTYLGPVAGSINALLKGGAAAFHGASETSIQAGKEIGQPELGQLGAELIEYAGTTGIPEVTMGPRAPVNTIPRAKTLGVIGEGEKGYFGTKAPEPVTEAARAEATKQILAEQEKAAPEAPGTVPEGTAPVETVVSEAPQVAAEASSVAAQAPDIHQTARQIAPDTFREYDAVSQRRDTFSRWMRELRETQRELAEANAPHAAEIDSLTEKLETASPRMRKKYEARLEAMEAERDAFIEKTTGTESPDMKRVREDFQKADYRMRDLGPAVAAAYRKARETAPEEISPAVSEAKALEAEKAPEKITSAPPNLPPVPEGHVRFYHGAKGEAADSGGGRWVTPDYDYARDFRKSDGDNEVYYVDVPKGHPSEVKARLWDEIDEQAGTNVVGRYQSVELPEDLAAQMKRANETDAAPVKAEAEQAEPSATSQEHLDAISKDVTKKLELAGRPKEEAQAAGQIIAAHYEARAARFDGERGNAYELFAKEAPTIRAARQRTKELAQRGRSLDQGYLPSSDSLNTPRLPTKEEMAKSSKVETVALKDARGTQSKMQWEKFDKGEHPGDLIEGYGDKPVAVRREDGEYLIFDGHHRVQKAIEDGRADMEMHVIDAKAFDPENAGRKKAEPKAGEISDDDLLRELGVSDTVRQTDTPEFKRWFGDSKVVDADGSPEVLYHTTSADVDFDTFKRKLNDIGIHFGTKGQAADRADYMRGKAVKHRGESERVMPVYLAIKSPLRLEDLGAWSADNLELGLRDIPGFTKEEIQRAMNSSRSANGKLTALRALIERKGYDGIVYKNTGEVEGSQALREKMDHLRTAVSESQKRRGKSQNAFDIEDQLTPEYIAYKEAYDEEYKFRHENGEDSYIAFHPEQIKSAIGNTGVFDPKNKSILAQGKKGSITLGNARNTIKLFKDADASTFIHETGHDWLEELFRDAGDAKVKQFVKDDAATVREWLGVKDGEAIPTKAHEKFARGFERYMMEGVAPSQKLAGVFAKFKDWLTKIYETVQKLRSPINDDIRAVFDRMLAESPEPVIAPERQGKRDMADFHEMEAETIAPEQASPAADQVRADIDDAIKKISPEVHDELPHKQAGGVPRADAVPDRGGDAAESGRGPEGSPAQRDQIAEGGNIAAEESLAAQSDAAIADSGTVNESTRAERAETAEPNTANERFGPLETELLDKAGNIRLDNLNTPDSVNEVIRQIAAENGEFLSERRGVITDAEVIDLADALGMDAGTLDKRKIGEAFNAEQIVAARKLLVKSGVELKQLMQKAATGTDADVMAYAAARDQFIMIQRQVSGATAEAGRALRAFRKLEGQEDAQLMASLIQEETGRTLNQLKQEAARGAQLDTTAKVAKFMNDSQKPTFADMILEFWINSLLSGPKTHVKNMLGNTFVAINSVAETAIASGVGKVLGSADRVHLNEAKARFFGITQGAKEGISAAKAIMDSEDAIAMTSHTVEKANKKSIPGTAGKIVRLPGRALAMEDELFKAIGYRQELNALAYREANKAGLTGDAFNAKVAELVTSPPEAMMETAKKNAEYQTFTNSLGPTGRAIQNFANSHFLAKFLVPFIRTPVNLLKFAGERTPLAPLSKNIRATLTGPDTVARDTQIARMALGTSITVAAAALAMEGSITGGGPSDTKQRAALRMTGWSPYSVKVGDMYYSYNWLDPFATIGGITADMSDIVKFGEAKDEEIGAIASDLMGSLVKSAASKTSLRGISSFLQMASDPDRYGEGYISSFAAGFVPAFVGQTNQILDPVVRRAETPLDAMKAKIPGLSQDLLPRRDVWGNEMVREGALGPDIASSIYESAVSDDPVNKAMIESGYFPSALGKKIRGVELTPQQYDDYSRVAGRMAKMQLDTIVKIPGFSQLPALERLTLMRSAVEGSRESARSLILLQNPELIQEAIKAKVGVEMAVPGDTP